jgi:hypothetical protein
MNKHEEILSKYVEDLFDVDDHRIKAITKENALKAMRELEESLSPASPVREALEKINEIFEAPDYGDSVIKRYNDIKKIVLAARTEGEGWTKVEDGLPELDESVNIAYWIQPAKGNGFWVVEVGYLQAITKRKTADGEKEYGEWKHGDQWNSSTPQYWARYRPLPSPPKTT